MKFRKNVKNKLQGYAGSKRSAWWLAGWWDRRLAKGTPHTK
jgi:hypothetical protein